jgi:hypothetical protein
MPPKPYRILILLRTAKNQFVVNLSLFSGVSGLFAAIQKIIRLKQVFLSWSNNQFDENFSLFSGAAGPFDENRKDFSHYYHTFSTLNHCETVV